MNQSGRSQTTPTERKDSWVVRNLWVTSQRASLYTKRHPAVSVALVTVTVSNTSDWSRKVTNDGRVSGEQGEDRVLTGADRDKTWHHVMMSGFISSEPETRNQKPGSLIDIQPPPDPPSSSVAPQPEIQHTVPSGKSWPWLGRHMGST